MDKIGIFKILVVLTSAMFAIAQYFDSRQRKFIKDEQDRIWALDYKDAEENPGMQDVKDECDQIQAIEILNNQPIIATLWVLFVFYSFLLALKLILPYVIELTILKNIFDSINFIKSDIFIFIIAVMAVALFLVSIWLTFNLKRMKNQLTEFRIRIRNFIHLYEAVSKSIKKTNKYSL